MYFEKCPFLWYILCVIVITSQQGAAPQGEDVCMYAPQ